MKRPSTVYERHQAILDVLKEHSSVSVPTLADALDVSEGTIRNDLKALDEQGHLRRVRGGAAALSQYTTPSNSTLAKAQVNAQQKQWIAQWASGQIDSGDVILLDASTTVLYIAEHLLDRSNLTVVTHGVEVARILASNPTNTIILIGNLLQQDGNTLVGQVDEAMLQTLNIQTAFVSCSGFSVDAGLLEKDIQIANLKKQILHACQKTIALIDSSKVGKGALSSFAQLSDIDHIVTDIHMAPEYVEAVRSSGPSVTICDEQTTSTYASYESTGSYRLGFANISEEMAFGRDVRRGLELAVQKTTNIELIVADNHLDPHVALANARSFLDQDIDLLIEYQIDEQVGNLISNRVSSLGIPIISVDIPMVGATFFGVDNYNAGLVAGKALGEAVQSSWDGRFDYLVIQEHPRAGSLPALRIQGQLDGFQQILGDVNLDRILRLDSGNTTHISKREMIDAIERVGPQNRFAVICFNDDAAIGSQEAARQLECEENLIIVGQGGDRRLRIELQDPATRIIGSTAFRPEAYGEKLLELAQKILQGESVPPAVYVDHIFINVENLNQYYPVDMRI
ncbi:MAG: DeoR family transcriptional regulator [Anaerolineae bacterium]|nr:DeoR family transcriptional regulator [Anaerolineae bacterium]